MPYPNIQHDALTVERALRTAYTDESGRKASKLRNEASRALGNILEAAVEAEEARVILARGLEQIANEPTPPLVPFASPNLKQYARDVLRSAPKYIRA